VSQELRAVLVLVAIGLAGLLGYLVLFGPPDPGQLTIHAIEGGDVQRVDASGSGRVAAVGDHLSSRERVVAGQGSRATLALGPEARVTVESGASIRVLGADGAGVQLELEGGKVRASIRGGGRKIGITADGRGASAEDADFDAARGADGTLAIAASRGRVDVSGIEGVADVEAGQRVVAPLGESPLRAPVSDDLLLQVSWPESRRLRERQIQVRGKTEPSATVRLGSGARTVVVRADRQGAFEAMVELAEGENLVEVHATSLLGAEAQVDARVTRDSTPPSIGVQIRYSR
jgi:hypothetical protein